MTQEGEAQMISEHEEYPIFEKLLNLKQRIMLLNKRNDMKSHDILPVQQQVEDAITQLMKIRSGVLFKKNHVKNRTDDELNKVCQLMSLCFMTIGKWHESPAIFCQVIAIKNCFYQLEQIGIYDEKILEPYNAKLKQLERILTEDEVNCGLSEPIMELVGYNYSVCKRIYDELLSTIKDMSPVLIPIRDQLLEIRTELVEIAFRDQYTAQDILPIQERLREIDSVRGTNGLFHKDAPDILALIGQGTLVDLLENNFNACHDLLNSEYSPKVDSIRQRLIDIKNDLQGIEMTSKWSLRQTDLFSYQLQLHDVTRMLHEHHQFGGEQGISMLSYLLAACYNIILNLLGEEPSVAESLLPIYNQLNTLRDCLKRLKSFQCELEEDDKMLYILKLKSIDVLRRDGAFHDDDGFIPEGQSKCVYALEECYRLIQDLSPEAPTEG
ncbi:hypothetical protein INT47_002517 [Mucor saturninus]|uniref:Uncharacterized protein n=1 Tax=Mucor saturninus TaxID=64648 RepID=A0A8H7V7Y6_9FUNG|nr:hypothetical protein INT47_002517 [Mucor saturninus]